MPTETAQPTDPRIRRTRQLLQESLEKLLEVKDFDKISVQDIVEAATINRATFYDHYKDKAALLECVVASRFHNLLSQRDVQFEGPCTSALRTLVVGLCEFLGKMKGPNHDRRLDPHMELAMVSVLRRIIVEGLSEHPAQGSLSPEIVAATVSGAIYGAAREWAQTPGRGSPAEIADTVLLLVSPVFQASQERASGH
ncbi:MAG: TetR/AcrR family transcriptional regulator [Acidobacteriota bacterium]